MKKRILFILPSYGIGGTIVSTRIIISLLEKKGYECWVMPLLKRGILSDLYINIKQIKTPFVIEALSYGGWKEAPTCFKKLFSIALRGVRHISIQFEKLLVGNALNKVISKQGFETVVACQESITSRLVSYSSCANKIAWVRCDYNRIFERNNYKKEYFYYSYNSIVCVAEETYKHFIAIYPEYEAKTYRIPNPQDRDFLIGRAQQQENESRFDNSKYTIVSVGRLAPVKRFEHIAYISKQLVEQGHDFRWYIIGDGSERDKIKQSIIQNNVGDYVIMLGAKTNPHYYIKNSDLYVCLSLSEACPRVINEAKVLHIPVISTDFDTAHEFIESENNGIICKIEDMANNIHRMMTDIDLKNKVIENLEYFHFDNTQILNQIESIL